MNTNIIQVTPRPDALLDRYNELAFTQNIPDIQGYADDWQALAVECKIHGRPALAGMAQARADFYRVQAEGEYVRLIDGSFSELIAVEV